MVDTLGSCLNHEMIGIGPVGAIIDTPHCKIACELLNSLFLVCFVKILRECFLIQILPEIISAE
ncbi:unnamed protein product [Gongylonema pulchrum]|uniref:Uncharacterized protein n=1 Tax=Gongylonema pulchrum TaxID=637853 RepID=A0A3P6TQG8_9BILA|nr:unnamed protein product [Gongylonema pulchrum]